VVVPGLACVRSLPAFAPLLSGARPLFRSPASLPAQSRPRSLRSAPLHCAPVASCALCLCGLRLGRAVRRSPLPLSLQVLTALSRCGFSPLRSASFRSRRPGAPSCRNGRPPNHRQYSETRIPGRKKKLSCDASPFLSLLFSNDFGIKSNSKKGV